MSEPAPNSPVAAPLDARKTQEIRSWKHDARLLALRVDPTGRFVFAGATDYTIQRWEIATEKKTPMKAHDNWVRALGCSTDGNLLFSGGYDGRLLTWEAAAAEPTPIRSIQAHQGWLRAIAVSPDGQWIATGGNDRVVRLWSSKDGQAVREFVGHPHFVFSLAFHPDGNDLVSGDVLGNILHWKVATGEQVRKLDATEMHSEIGDWSHYGGVLSVAFSRDGKRLSATGLHKTSNALANGQEGVSFQYDWEAGTRTRKQESVAEQRSAMMWRGIWHASGQFIGSLSEHLGFWQADQDDLYHAIDMKAAIFDMDLHPNQQELYTAHFDGQVKTMRLIAS